MSEYLVCLTFDFDAMTGLVARGLTTPTPVSRGEFGAIAVDRILPLLERHRIPASWFAVVDEDEAEVPDLLPADAEEAAPLLEAGEMLDVGDILDAVETRGAAAPPAGFTGAPERAGLPLEPPDLFAAEPEPVGPPSQFL